MGEYSRLGSSVVPIHYNLRLDPDLNTFVFTGEVVIDVQVNKTLDKIVLNANDLEIESIQVRNTSKKHQNGNGKVQSREVVSNIQDKYKNITFGKASPLPPGLNISVSRVSEESDVKTVVDSEEASSLQKRLFANSNITLSRASDASKLPEDESSNKQSFEKSGRKCEEDDSDDDDDKRSLKRRKVVDNEHDDGEGSDDDQSENVNSDCDENDDDDVKSDGINEKDEDNQSEKSDENEEDKIIKGLYDVEEGKSKAVESDKSDDDSNGESKNKTGESKEWKFPERTKSDSSDNGGSDSDSEPEPEPKKDSPVMFAMWAKPDDDKEEEIEEEVKDKKTSYMDVNKLIGIGADWDDESDTEEKEEEDETDKTNVNTCDDEVVICDDSDDEPDQQNDDSDEEEERASSPDILNVDGNMEYSEDESDDNVRVSKWTLDTELLIIDLDDDLDEGTATITVKFTGKLDDSMRGFYRTKHSVGGKEKWGAACHFEATGARKCFPCFDQPEFRSTFDISMVQHEPDIEVLSNMPLKKTTDNGDSSLLEFCRTPALPSYLVCVIMGYYDSISRRATDGTKVSIYTRQGETKQGEFALNVAVQALDYFKKFFGLGYTLPKIDLVAVPDFYIGAMENWGLLTFRETALMYNPGVSTAARRQYVAILVSHEIAHQWFGNLVSISWWDQLWLKEGYATWISYLAVDKLFPEMDIWSQFLVEERDAALDLDCLTSSHPIELKGGVQNPGQIDEIFDTISYCKGASVINMLYRWLGDEMFRTGMGAYLAKYRGKAASTQQLWDVLEQSSQLPVANVMSGWTKRQGFPLVTVEILKPGLVRLSQSQFSSSDAGWWQLPLTLTWGFTEADTQAVLLDDRRVDIELDVDYGDWLVVNQGQSGYCRVCYGPDQLRALQEVLPRLGTRDRLGVLSDLSSVTGVKGRGGVGQLLGMLEKYGGEVEWPVVDTLMIVMGRLEGILEDSPAWVGYLQMCYRILVPSLDKLGWEGVAGEKPGRMLSRIAVIGRLCHLGHCETSGEAWVRWRAEQRGKGRVAPDLRDPVYREVARTGGREEMEKLKAMYRGSGSAEERRMLGRALASSRNVDMARETLQWAMSGDVKQQDRVFIISGVAAGGDMGRKVAWAFFQDNFSTLTSQYKSGSLLTSLVRAVARHFSSYQDAEEVEEWFSSHYLEGADRTVRQVLEEVRSRAERRTEELDTIVEYFRKINK